MSKKTHFQTINGEEFYFLRPRLRLRRSTAERLFERMHKDHRPKENEMIELLLERVLTEEQLRLI